MTNRLSGPRLRLREPVDVLAAIPYLIGYQPHDSVVVLAMQGRRLYFTLREDLPARDGPDDVVAVVEEMLGLRRPARRVRRRRAGPGRPLRTA
jgi:hypothetical protein